MTVLLSFWKAAVSLHISIPVYTLIGNLQAGEQPSPELYRIPGLVKKSSLHFSMVWLRMVPDYVCKFTSMVVKLGKPSNFMTLRTTVVRLSGVQADCKSHLSP